jgi:hypothetical protein
MSAAFPPPECIRTSIRGSGLQLAVEEREPGIYSYNLEYID